MNQIETIFDILEKYLYKCLLGGQISNFYSGNNKRASIGNEASQVRYFAFKQLFWHNRDQNGKIGTKNGEMVPIGTMPKNRDRASNQKLLLINVPLFQIGKENRVEGSSVYSIDYKDTEQVMRVENLMRSAGVTTIITYKPNMFSALEIYMNNKWASSQWVE